MCEYVCVCDNTEQYVELYVLDNIFPHYHFLNLISINNNNIPIIMWTHTYQNITYT